MVAKIGPGSRAVRISPIQTFLQYYAAVSGGVVAAEIITILLIVLLPTPSGPPDQAAGQLMALVYGVFPLLAVVLGGIAIYIAKGMREG